MRNDKDASTYQTDVCQFFICNAISHTLRAQLIYAHHIEICVSFCEFMLIFFFCILVNQCLQSLQSSWRHDQNQNKKRCEQSENYGTQALVVSSCRRMCMVLQHNLIRDYKWTRKCAIDCLCFASHTSLYNPLIVINLMCKHSDLKRKWPMSS